MKAPVVTLDFATPRMRTTRAGMALLVAGLAALTAVGMQYHADAQKRAGLEMRLAAATQAAAAHDPTLAQRNARLNEQAAGVARELAAPWTTMLAELEVASKDSSEQIAVLSVEPDLEKHRVRISGESKDLQTALDYLQRLQTSHSLRHPMLDSHEIVADNTEHPVRFAMTADWQEQP
jgi:DMSO/TMAO reductase YedYZ molybdopterin-dependent catalytic subunit